MNSSIRAGLAARPPATQWLSDAQGRRLAFSAYPAREPALHLLISHGLGEHRGWYDHVARAFSEQGISTYIFDNFHHGHSDGRPGDAPHFGVLTAGLRLALEKGVAPLRPAGEPLALLGHSNGGLVALQALRELPPGVFSAVVLSNPLLGLPRRLAVWGRALGRLIALFAPGLMIPLRIVPRLLTSDRGLWPDYGRDPLRFRAVSVRFFLAMAGQARATREARWAVDCRASPLLLLLSGKDCVVDSAATLGWFEALEWPTKELISYPELRHEILNETEWREVVREAAAWLRRSCGAAAL